METIINAIAAILIVFCIFRIYKGSQFSLVKHPLIENEQIYVVNHMNFAIFGVYTAMFFLGPFSELKYVIWILTFMILLFSSSFRVIWDGVMFWYLLFLLWCVFTLTYSEDTTQGGAILLKYFLPIFYLWLGYNALSSKESFWYFLRCSCVALVVYAIMLGGGMSKFGTPIYAYLNWGTGGLFVSYASLADFFSVMCVVPLAMYFITKQKKFLFIFGLLLLSTVLDVVRTGIAGIMIAASLFVFIRFKVRALPIVVGLFLGLMAIIFMVPEVREKMFGNNDSENITLSRDNVQSNARESIWEIHMDRFYHPSPDVGSGLGTSLSYQKNNFSLKLIHSDYVQMLCDTGNVGLGLFLLFFLFMIFKALSVSSRYQNQTVQLLAAMAVGSSGGMLFSMGFDNVVTYGQQCFIFPFLFYGMFIKSTHLVNSGNL